MAQRLRNYWTPARLLDAAVVFCVIYVTVWSLHPSLLFSSTTITGGDTGSHLALPAYLRSQGDLFNLTPWYPGWFAGMPAYTYYFVLPDFLATLASYVINFAVAFKIATILGSVLMPITAYVMAKLFKAPRPVPAALALATLPFLFDASFTIDGGNLFSTMAGEYAFSLSLALSLLTIGLFARGVRTGRGYWWAALSLGATLASHVLPWFFAIGAVGVLVVFELLARRGIGDPRDRDMVRGDYARPLRFAMGAGLLSVGLSMWWLIPFGTTQSLTNSMGYTNDNVATLHAVFTWLGWFNSSGGAAGDRWVIVLAAFAFVAAFWVRDRLGMVLATLTALSLVAFVLDPQSVIWNERLVPFWFITTHLSAGWLFGYFLSRWVDRSPIAKHSRGALAVGGGADAGDASNKEEVLERARGQETSVDPGPEVDQRDDVEARTRRRTIRATFAVALLGLVSTVPGLIPAAASRLHLSTSGNQVSSWAQWNYSGYQTKPAWPEYHDVITTMQGVAKRFGCGRAMWEYNANENRFGTPEALMLLPYWTNNCVDSMEGLFFESSPTTPYHFLDQAELSASPSNPQVGLSYGTLDVAQGVEHLQMLGVKYYIAYSPMAVSEAEADPQLSLVASTKKWPSPGATWRVFLIKNSPMVEALTYLPNVISGISTRVGWLDANTSWWLNPDLWSVTATDSGPASWPRASSIEHMKRSLALPKVTVSKVVVGAQSISFHVSRVGVPVLVKISYFPRWRASGATGPYRVSPNLMVVVPTSNDVSMVYGNSLANEWGNAVTALTILAGLATLAFGVKRRRNLRK
jgi:hypothetical protein